MSELIGKERGKDANVIVVVEIEKIIPIAKENSAVMKNIEDMKEVLNFSPLLERMYGDMAI